MEIINLTLKDIKAMDMALNDIKKYEHNIIEETQVIISNEEEEVVYE